MKSFSCSILLLSLFISAQAYQIQRGDPVTVVLDTLGQPSGIIDKDGIEAYSYPQGVIRIQEGIVISISEDFYEKSGIYDFEGNAPDKEVPGNSKSLQLTLGQEEPDNANPATPTFRWYADYDKALAVSAETQRPMLLYFTGSDWCGWCHRLQDEVLSTDSFKAFAEDNLILVELDYPNGKQLPQKIVEQNDRLKKQWGIRGFPTLVLLDAEENYLTRGGYARAGPEPFLQWLSSNLPNNPNYSGPQAQPQVPTIFGNPITSPMGILKILLIAVGALVLLNKLFRR